MWINKETWRAAGHNVTLLEHPDRGGVQYSYMDYGGPSKKCPDIHAVAELVRQTYVGVGKYVGVTWCAAQPNLKPWIVHWG